MRIIFSRDRPAQLDLLLRSLDRNAPPDVEVVIWRASTHDHSLGYHYVAEERPYAAFMLEDDFNSDLRRLLHRKSEDVTFLCDDDVLYAPVPDPAPVLDDERVLCVSWRLGLNNAQQARPFATEDGDLLKWTWTGMPPHDFGYPGSIDGHTFRTADVRRILGDHPIANPTQLETVLARRCGVLDDERPLMACYRQQALVGIPVNRVSEDSGVANGKVYPQPTRDLLRNFLGGERIDLDAMDFSGVDACHVEMRFPWRQT